MDLNLFRYIRVDVDVTVDDVALHGRLFEDAVAALAG